MFENMRKILIIRSPYTISNLTDINYFLHLFELDGKIFKKINLKPGDVYPIGNKDMECKFSLSSEYTPHEWSNPIKIRTLVERVPKNTTVIT